MIPYYIRPYFRTISQEEGDGLVVEGEIVCCEKHNFDTYTNGKVCTGWFSDVYLIPDNDEMALEVRCKQCGKAILIFKSSCDGYDCYEEERCEPTSVNKLLCPKCLNSDFSVSIKYEYPDLQELEEIEVEKRGNAFTWIRITLVCNRCGKKYHNFIDFETA